jgi:hypothetical protein
MPGGPQRAGDCGVLPGGIPLAVSTGGPVGLGRGQDPNRLLSAKPWQASANHAPRCGWRGSGGGIFRARSIAPEVAVRRLLVRGQEPTSAAVARHENGQGSPTSVRQRASQINFSETNARRGATSMRRPCGQQRPERRFSETEGHSRSTSVRQRPTSLRRDNGTPAVPQVD